MARCSRATAGGLPGSCPGTYSASWRDDSFIISMATVAYPHRNTDFDSEIPEDRKLNSPICSMLLH